MSTNKTENYQLHAWALEDDFLTSEINENFAALDTALKAEAAAAGQAVQAEASARAQQAAALSNTITQSVNALNAAIGSLEGRKAELTVGSYVGNDTANRFIPLGFTPRAVLVVTNSGQTSSSNGMVWGGLAVTGSWSGLKGSSPAVAVANNGFTVSNEGNYIIANYSSHTYNYMAFR